MVAGPLSGSLALYYLKKIRGERSDLGTAFSGFSICFVPLLLAGLVSFVLTVLGLICLVLPGIYLAVAWVFAKALVIDKGLDFWPAMELSRRTVSKHWWKFFWFMIVLGLFNLAGLAFCVVGLFLTTPISLVAIMYAYEDIFGAAAIGARAPSSAGLPIGTPSSSAGKSPGLILATAGVLVLGMLSVALALFFVVRASHRTHRMPRPNATVAENEHHRNVRHAFAEPAQRIDAEEPSVADNSGQTVATLPPVVVSTQPMSGAPDVEPGVVEIRAKFSKEMADGSWSWCTAWDGSMPEMIGQPFYEPDERTCVLKVRLEPDRTYATWLNTDNIQNFTDRTGRPAVPYLLIFQTKQN